MSDNPLEFEFEALLGLGSDHKVKVDPATFFAEPLDPAYRTSEGAARTRPFELDLFGPSAPFLLALSQVRHQDPLLMTMSILTAVSAKVAAFLDGEQEGKNFSFALTLHTIIVGPKGDNKDPGLLLGRKQLERGDRDRMAAYRTELAEYDAEWSIHNKVLNSLQDGEVAFRVRAANGELEPGEKMPAVVAPQKPTLRTPLRPNSVYIKGTPEGLEAANVDNWSCCNWMTEEGSAIFSRVTGPDAPNVLTLMISGIQGTHSGTTTAGKEFRRDVPRFVFSLLTSVQPRLFFKWIRTVYATRTELDTGWLERCIILWTTPTPILSTSHPKEKVDLAGEVLDEVFDFLDQLSPIYDPAVMDAAAEEHRTGKAPKVKRHKWSDGTNKIIPRVQWSPEAMEAVDPYAKAALSARANNVGSGWEEDDAPLDIEITNIMKSGQHVARIATLIEILWWAQKNRKTRFGRWDLNTARRELPVVSIEAANAALQLVRDTLLPMKSDLMTMPIRKDNSIVATDLAERASRFSPEELKTKTFLLRDMLSSRWVKRATMDARLKSSPDAKQRDIYEQSLGLLSNDNVALQVEPGVWMFNPQLSAIHSRFDEVKPEDDWRFKEVDLNALRMSGGTPFTAVSATGEGHEHFLAATKDVPQEIQDAAAVADALEAEISAFDAELDDLLAAAPASAVTPDFLSYN